MLALDVARAGGIDESWVILTSTFIEDIVPSLRVGWVVAAAPVIHKLMLLKQAADLHTSTLNQIMILDVADALLAGHLLIK